MSIFLACAILNSIASTELYVYHRFIFLLAEYCNALFAFFNYDMFLLFKPLAQRSAVGYTLFDGAVKCGGK